MTRNHHTNICTAPEEVPSRPTSETLAEGGPALEPAARHGDHRPMPSATTGTTLNDPDEVMLAATDPHAPTPPQVWTAIYTNPAVRSAILESGVNQQLTLITLTTSTLTEIAHSDPERLFHLLVDTDPARPETDWQTIWRIVASAALLFGTHPQLAETHYASLSRRLDNHAARRHRLVSRFLDHPEQLLTIGGHPATSLPEAIRAHQQYAINLLCSTAVDRDTAPLMSAAIGELAEQVISGDHTLVDMLITNQVSRPLAANVSARLDGRVHLPAHTAGALCARCGTTPAGIRLLHASDNPDAAIESYLASNPGPLAVFETLRNLPEPMWHLVGKFPAHMLTLEEQLGPTRAAEQLQAAIPDRIAHRPAAQRLLWELVDGFGGTIDDLVGVVDAATREDLPAMM